MSFSLAQTYCALVHQKVISRTRLQVLLPHFGSVATMLSAPTPLLLEHRLNRAQIKLLRTIARGEFSDPQLDRDMCWAGQPGHHLVGFEMATYPVLLREISQPPLMLYVAGEIAALGQPQFAIVGSRNASSSGRRNAHWLAGELAQSGLSICSGLAAGIDTEAHEGALDAGSNTVAVLGTGINVIYPRRNADLVTRIITQGALVSELPLDSPPLAAHFPQRNRIISGMSAGVLVVEATLNSGSLITAACALEQNREVFAIPGAINNPSARGCNRLIQNGARLIESAQEILQGIASLLEFHFQQSPITASDRQPHSTTHVSDDLTGLSPLEKKLLQGIGYDGCQLEQLLTDCEVDLPSLNAAVLQLELLGLIEQHAGRLRRLA